MSLQDWINILVFAGLLFLLVYRARTKSVWAAKTLPYYCLLVLAGLWDYLPRVLSMSHTLFRAIDGVFTFVVIPIAVIQIFRLMFSKK